MARAACCLEAGELLPRRAARPPRQGRPPLLSGSPCGCSLPEGENDEGMPTAHLPGLAVCLVGGSSSSDLQSFPPCGGQVPGLPTRLPSWTEREASEQLVKPLALLPWAACLPVEAAGAIGGRGGWK